MNPNNPFEQRWRWWYPAIADWMLANPGRPMTECAKDLGRGYNTIIMIVNTDLYRDFLAKRRKEWEVRHDHALREKTTRVAEKSLDLLVDQLDKKRDQIPVRALAEIATSALDRLGYSPNKPQPAPTMIQNNGGVVVVPVNQAALTEAREAIRLAQARRAAAAAIGAPSDVPSLPLSSERVIDGECVESAERLPGAISSD